MPHLGCCCGATRVRQRVSPVSTDDGPAFAAWYSGADADSGVALGEQFEESYVGEFDSLGDYAQELATDIGDVTGSQLTMWPFTCIDWERAGRELEMGGDVWTADASADRVWIFR